jgi:hypothetical protein
MRRRPARVAFLAALATLLSTLAAAATVASHAQAAPLNAPGSWGPARSVAPPKPAAATTQVAQILSVYCAAAGNCTAVGHFSDDKLAQRAMAVTEVNGIWGKAVQPYSTTANFVDGSTMLTVACTKAGTCDAGGFVTESDTGGSWQAGLLANQAGGTFRGSNFYNAFRKGMLFSAVSCPPKAACGAGGYYTDASGNRQAYVVNESPNQSDWPNGIEVPGSMTLNAGGHAEVTTISCPATTDCTAAGFYTDALDNQQAFAVNELNGTWSTAKTLAAVLNAGGTASVNSISCAARGNCLAVGYYFADRTHSQALVATSDGGDWTNFMPVPGSVALNAGGSAYASTVSCSPGSGPLNCSVGGRYVDAGGHRQAFVATVKNGVWQQAKRVAGSLNTGGNAAVDSISCPSPGNCAAGGSYADTAHHVQAFTVVEEGGGWKKAQQLPNAGPLNSGGNAVVTSVSCPTVGFCAAGGYYSAGGNVLPFLANGSITQPTGTALALSAGTVTFGHEQAEKLTVTVNPRYAGPAAGAVVVKAGGITICTITLSRGKGTFTFTAKKLRAGTYHLQAFYRGATFYAASSSVKRTLVVKN